MWERRVRLGGHRSWVHAALRSALDRSALDRLPSTARASVHALPLAHARRAAASRAPRRRLTSRGGPTRRWTHAAAGGGRGRISISKASAAASVWDGVEMRAVAPSRRPSTLGVARAPTRRGRGLSPRGEARGPRSTRRRGSRAAAAAGGVGRGVGVADGRGPRRRARAPRGRRPAPRCGSRRCTRASRGTAATRSPSLGGAAAAAGPREARGSGRRRGGLRGGAPSPSSSWLPGRQKPVGGARARHARFASKQRAQVVRLHGGLPEGCGAAGRGRPVRAARAPSGGVAARLARVRSPSSRLEPRSAKREPRPQCRRSERRWGWARGPTASRRGVDGARAGAARSPGWPSPSPTSGRVHGARGRAQRRGSFSGMGCAERRGGRGASFVPQPVQRRTRASKPSPTRAFKTRIFAF